MKPVAGPRTIMIVLATALSFGFVGGCAGSSPEEVDAGHDPEPSQVAGEVPRGSAEYLRLLNTMAERNLRADFGAVTSLAEYQKSFESGDGAGKLKFGLFSGEIESVGKLSRGANPFGGVLPDRAENLQLTLAVNGEHRVVQVLVGVQVADENSELVSVNTSEDQAALEKSAPIGARWIVAGAEDGSGDFYASLMIAGRGDGTAVSYGPPIADDLSFAELEAQAAALASN